MFSTHKYKIVAAISLLIASNAQANWMIWLGSHVLALNHACYASRSITTLSSEASHAKAAVLETPAAQEPLNRSTPLLSQLNHVGALAGEICSLGSVTSAANSLKETILYSAGALCFFGLAREFNPWKKKQEEKLTSQAEAKLASKPVVA